MPPVALIGVVAENNVRFLCLMGRQESDQAFIVHVSDLNPVAERIPEIAPKIRSRLKAIFLGDLFTDGSNLLVIADNEAEVPTVGRGIPVPPSRAAHL